MDLRQPVQFGEKNVSGALINAGEVATYDEDGYGGGHNKEGALEVMLLSVSVSLKEKLRLV